MSNPIPNLFFLGGWGWKLQKKLPFKRHLPTPSPNPEWFFQGAGSRCGDWFRAPPRAVAGRMAIVPTERVCEISRVTARWLVLATKVLRNDGTPGMNKHEPPKKKTGTRILSKNKYWLFNKDPYNGFMKQSPI